MALLQKSLRPAPTLGSGKRTGGTLLAGSGFPTTSYSVEAAPSLSAPIAWSVITTVQADGAGLIQFADTDIHHYPARF